MPTNFYPDLAKRPARLAASRSPINGRIFIAPCSKSRRTANEVLKQAGLPKAF